jgi:hypothetical protein
MREIYVNLWSYQRNNSTCYGSVKFTWGLSSGVFKVHSTDNFGYTAGFLFAVDFYGIWLIICSSPATSSTA